jgi:hypothetical protein
VWPCIFLRAKQRLVAASRRRFHNDASVQRIENRRHVTSFVSYPAPAGHRIVGDSENKAPTMGGRIVPLSAGMREVDVKAEPGHLVAI